MKRPGGGRGRGREVAAAGADQLRPALRAPSSAARASPASWETRRPAAVHAHSAPARMAHQARATRKPTASWNAMARGLV